MTVTRPPVVEPTTDVRATRGLSRTLPLRAPARTPRALTATQTRAWVRSVRARTSRRDP